MILARDLQSSVLEIGQAFYGSFSGYRDYDILAASPAAESGFRRDEREIVSLRSNLGGSAQTAASFAPIYTFYELPQRKEANRQHLWVFSRTVWLGRGPRGNDYLAHVLALDKKVMDQLRGDPFLLLECEQTTKDLMEKKGPVFSTEKPLNDERLQPIYVPLWQVEQLAFRPCGADLDPRLETRIAAGFLHAVVHGSLAVSLDDGEAATSLCRSIVSLLPPEDRETLSFCSRFSLPRRTSFRLAVYAGEDRSLAERYLAGFDPAADARAGDASLWWIDACREQKIEPFYKLSLFDKGGIEGAIGKVQALAGEIDLSGVGPLQDIVSDPRNERFSPRQQVLLIMTWKEIRDEAEAVLRSRPIDALEAACQKLWSYDRGGSFLVSKVREAADQHGSGGFEMEETTAILALAVLVPGRERPALVLAPERGSALFWEGQAARWMIEVADRNPEACRRLLIAWFTGWRQSDGKLAIYQVCAELKQLPREDGRASDTAETVFDALWEVAPKEEQERIDWRIELLRKSRDLEPLLAVGDVARCALDQRLLAGMEESEAVYWIRVNLSNAPLETAKWLEWEKPSPSILILVATVCSENLVENWPGLNSSHWTLIVSLADLLVRKAPFQDPELGMALSELLFLAADRAPRATVSRIASVLWATLEARPPGGTDLLVLAAAALVLRGEAAISAGQALWSQSEEDFWLGGAPGGAQGALLLDRAWKTIATS